MREYARRQATVLLRALENEIDRAAEKRGPDRVHDLRVAIRRLSRCLAAFSQFYPRRRRKQARARLSGLLHTAGVVRDRDIALELLAQAGVSRRAAVVVKLKGERTQASQELEREIERWRDRGLARKWRAQLGLEP